MTQQFEMAPHEALRRYRWAIMPQEYNTDADADTIQTNAIMAADTLFEALHLSAEQTEGVKNDLFADEYDSRGLTFSDWLIQWKLLPLRMAYREEPVIEELDNKYIAEAMVTALQGEDRHQGHYKYGKSLNHMACEIALICPQKAIAQLTERVLQLTIVHLNFNDLDLHDAARAHGVVDMMRNILVGKGLLKDDQWVSILGVVDMYAKSLTHIMAPSGPNEQPAAGGEADGVES